LATQTGPAVAQDQRVDRSEQSITGRDVARNGRLNQIVIGQLPGGTLFGHSGTGISCSWSRIGADDADLGMTNATMPTDPVFM